MNPGGWAKNALQLQQSPEEYVAWEGGILERGKDHWEKIASFDSSHVNPGYSCHYWLVEGHQIVVYVSREALPFIPMG